MKCECASCVQKYVLFITTLLNIIFDNTNDVVIKHICRFEKIFNFQPCCQLMMLYLETIRGLCLLIQSRTKADIGKEEWKCVIRSLKFARRNRLAGNFGNYIIIF